jgi:hypothetical protein
MEEADDAWHFTAVGSENLKARERGCETEWLQIPGSNRLNAKKTDSAALTARTIF